MARAKKSTGNTTPSSPSDAMPPGAQVSPGADFPLRLELLLRDPPGPAGVDPFVVLNDGGEHARVYLGRILAGQRTVLRHVAVKLAPRRGQASGIEGQTLSNAQRLRRWEREWKHYRAMAEVPAGVTPVYFIQPGQALAGSEPRPLIWPPLIFCALTRSLLQPRSRQGGRLSVCRDDSVLTQNGLPPHGGSYTFLWDAEAVAAGEAPTFYQIPAPGAEQTVGPAEPFDACLRATAELLANPGELVARGSDGGLAHIVEIARDFPAILDEEVRKKLVAEDPVKVFSPWHLDETPVLVLELNRFHYDEFCDLLGGIEGKTFATRYGGPKAAVGQRLRLGDSLNGEGSSPRLLFSADSTGLDAVERFRLKWSLFSQLCGATLVYQRRCGAPHLRLSPRHVMVQVEPSGEGLPSLWNFQTRLISLGSPTLEVEGMDLPEIFVPPLGTDPLYQAELVRNSSFGIAQRGDFLLTGVEKSKAEGRSEVVAQIHHEGIGLRWLSPKDHMLVTLGKHLVAEAEIEFMAHCDESKDYSGRIIYLKSLPLELDKDKVAALEKLKGIRVPNAQFRLLPTMHVPCDLFSLGMLLYRAMIVNDGQGIGEVALALDGLRQDLNSLAVVECVEGQEASFWEALLSGHRNLDAATIFDRPQIFFHEHQRAPDRPNAIPKCLWHEVMALGLKLVTLNEDFSFCANHGDYDPEYPSARLEPLTRRVAEMGRKIDTALFSFTARNAEIRQALEHVAPEMTIS